MAASILRKLVRNFPENGPKLLLENPANVRDLLTLLHEPAVEAIDFASMTVERTHFVKPHYAHVALDLLLKAPLRATDSRAESVLIYILVEHQSRPERFFQLRLMEYVLETYKMQKRNWDQEHGSDADLFLQPVFPIVLYTGERSWQRPSHLADLVHEAKRFESMIPRFEPHFLNLRDTPPEALSADGGFFGQVLRLIRDQGTNADTFRQIFQEVLARLERMSGSDPIRWVEFLSFALALVYHARNEREHDGLRELVDQSVQADPHRREYNKMGRTIAEMFIDKGRAEGEIKGIEKGSLQKGREILLRLLRKRFKKVPRPIAARIASTTNVEELDTWLDNVVEAATIEEVGIK